MDNAIFKHCSRLLNELPSKLIIGSSGVKREYHTGLVDACFAFYCCSAPSKGELNEDAKNDKMSCFVSFINATLIREIMSMSSSSVPLEPLSFSPPLSPVLGQWKSSVLLSPRLWSIICLFHRWADVEWEGIFGNKHFSLAFNANCLTLIGQLSPGTKMPAWP